MLQEAWKKQFLTSGIKRHREMACQDKYTKTRNKHRQRGPKVRFVYESDKECAGEEATSIAKKLSNLCPLYVTMHGGKLNTKLVRAEWV